MDLILASTHFPSSPPPPRGLQPTSPTACPGRSSIWCARVLSLPACCCVGWTRSGLPCALDPGVPR
eukprot:12910681-Prorocentrum_lima.AAC.1